MTKKQILTTLSVCFVIEITIIASAVYMLEKPIPKQTVCQICAKTKAMNDYCSSCFDMDDFSDLFQEIDISSHTVAL